MVICLERGADLHMAQLKPLPLTVSCFSKIQFGFAFLVPVHPGSPGKRAVKRVKRVCLKILFASANTHTHIAMPNQSTMPVGLVRHKIILHCESKKQDTIFLSVTSPDVNRFSNFFHC